MNHSAEVLLARLRFRHLQLIDAVDRTGSLRASARDLHLTQSSLSKALKEIETAFDVRLFERTSRGLRATEQGRLIVAGSKLLITELAHLSHEIETTAGRADAILRLGALPFIAPTLIPSLLVALLRQTPRMMMRLHEARVPKLLEDLLLGELDALITTYTVDTQTDEGSKQLRYEILFKDDFVVVAPKTHSLAGADHVAWARLAGEPWILPARFSFLRRLVDEAFLREGVSPPSPIVESDNAATNVNIAASGVGLTAVPATTVRGSPCSAAVRQIHVLPELGSTRVAVMYRSSSENHPRIRLLRQALASVLNFDSSVAREPPISDLNRTA